MEINFSSLMHQNNLNQKNEISQVNNVYRKMSIGFVGLGFVGLSMSCVIARKGFTVLGTDINKQKISMLNQGKPPFFEPNLNEILQKVLGKNLKFNSDLPHTVKNSELIFVCVGTPSQNDGSPDLSYLRDACEQIGVILSKINDDLFRVIVIKSTIPPMTIETVVKPLLVNYSKKRIGIDFGLSMNPEFLKEGSAINDMLNPHLVVIGADDEKSRNAMRSFYEKTYPGFSHIMETSIVNAEIIKYANNSFLATKISFINTIANICNKIPGSNIEIIAEAIGRDPRIGDQFLKAGPGYGGSCFPKDVQGFLNFSRSIGYKPELLESTHSVNQNQPLVIFNMIKNKINDLENKKIAILGLAFKKNTDDIRESVSIKIVKYLLENKTIVKVHDPLATENFKQIFNKSISYYDNMLECITDTDCCVLVTDWDEYKKLKADDFKKHMRFPLLIDTRRLYDPKNMLTIEYLALGYGQNI